MIIYLILAFFVRLPGLWSSAIWFDETISYYRGGLPWAAYLADNSEYAIGPNLWDLILRPFAGGPVWVFRIPSLFFGMVALWLCWRIMVELKFTRYQIIIAASGLIFLPGLLWQAQDARCYAGVGALFMGCILFAIKGRPLGLTACMGLIAFMHPTGGAYALAGLAVAMIFGMSSKTVLWILGGAVGCWGVRYLLLVINACLSNCAFWLNDTSIAYIFDQTIEALFVHTLRPGLMFIALIGLLAIITIAAIRARNNRVIGGLLVALLIPIVIMLLVGWVWRPVFFYRPVGPVGLIVCLLSGYLLAPTEELKRSWSWTPAALTGILLLVSFTNYNPSTRGGHINQVSDAIREEWQPGDLIIYASGFAAAPFYYYLSDLQSCIYAFDGIDPELLGLPPCEDLTPEQNRAWLVYNAYPPLTQEQERALIMLWAGHDPLAVTDAWQFAKITVWLIDF